MKFMFESRGLGDRFVFGGPPVKLELALGKAELVQGQGYPDRERVVDRVEFSFVLTNAGGQPIEIKRLEFCAWKGEQLVGHRHHYHWYNGEELLPPGTMYSDHEYFDLSELPDKFTGQLSVVFAGNDL